MSDQSSFQNESLGVWYPEKCVVGAVPADGTEARLVETLQRNGFAEEDIRLWRAEELRAYDKAQERQQGFFKRLVKRIDDIASEEGQFLQDYIERLDQGKQIITVHAPDEERKMQAVKLLHEGKAELVRYYDRATIEAFD